MDDDSVRQMKNSAAPCLLVSKDLLKPVGEAIQRISEIRSEASKGNLSNVAREGLIVLAVASVETMLTDVTRYYLKQFPQKIRRKEFTIKKDDLLSWRSHLVEGQIDEEVNRVSYQNFESQLVYFRETLSLSAEMPKDVLNKILEIKERRNLLLHNNLLVNGTYVSKAGPLAQGINVDERLQIDTAYLNDSLACLADFCLWAETEITAKYASYTKCSAIKRLWQFLFHSPVMVFEDYWEIDEDRDRILSYKGSIYEDEGLLSNSELMFLAIWRAHFQGIPRSLDNFAMFSLDDVHQAKMLYFLSVLGEFRLG